MLCLHYSGCLYFRDVHKEGLHCAYIHSKPRLAFADVCTYYMDTTLVVLAEVYVVSGIATVQATEAGALVQIL